MPKEVFATTPKVTVTREPIKGPAPPQRVTIYNREGAACEVYQIDAKEIVAGGEYSYDPPVIVAEPEVALVTPEPLATESLTVLAEETARRRGRPPREVQA